MSLSPLITIDRVLYLRDIESLENWEDRLPEIALVISASQSMSKVVVSNFQVLTKTVIFEAILRHPNITTICFLLCQVDSRTLDRMIREMPQS